METEESRAAFYQSHKDDPDVWGELERPRHHGPRKRLSATITVRFSAEESELIRRVAEGTRTTYSEVVRRAVRALAQPWLAQAGSTNPLFQAGPMNDVPALSVEMKEARQSYTGREVAA